MLFVVCLFVCLVVWLLLFLFFVVGRGADGSGGLSVRLFVCERQSP